MNLSGWILKRMGWRFKMNVAPVPHKCVICVAPHTSNWDFVLGELGSRSMGYKSAFMIKDTWFFFPMNHLMRALGGVPVKQHAHTHVSEQMVDAFNSHEKLWLAITPEGTRSRNSHWHMGIIHIAQSAGVPLLLGYIDYGERLVCIDREQPLSGNPEHDMIEIKRYYAGRTARYPENFATGLDDDNTNSETT